MNAANGRPALATRVRKARRSSLLGCGHHVLAGQLIVKRPGEPWTCLPCCLAALTESHKQAG